MNWTVTFNRGRRDIAVGVGKFFLAAVACSILWMFALSVLDGGPSNPNETSNTWTSFFQLILVMSTPSIIAAFVYFQLPERTVDWYHKFGKLFAMFVAVNISLSAIFVVFSLSSNTVITGEDHTVMGVMVLWVLSSLFLPAPYVGSIIGARWVQWSERGGFL